MQLRSGLRVCCRLWCTRRKSLPGKPAAWCCAKRSSCPAYDILLELGIDIDGRTCSGKQEYGYSLVFWPLLASFKCMSLSKLQIELSRLTAFCQFEFEIWGESSFALSKVYGSYGTQKWSPKRIFTADPLPQSISHDCVTPCLSP